MRVAPHVENGSEVQILGLSFFIFVVSLQVYLSLLRMYLSPPDAHCLGPIKMELSEPQANLQAALQVLELHHSKLDTTKVSEDDKTETLHHD